VITATRNALEPLGVCQSRWRWRCFSPASGNSCRGCRRYLSSSCALTNVEEIERMDVSYHGDGREPHTAFLLVHKDREECMQDLTWQTSVGKNNTVHDGILYISRQTDRHACTHTTNTNTHTQRHTHSPTHTHSLSHTHTHTASH